MDSAALFAPVSEPDTTARDAATEQLGTMESAHGAAGRLGELAAWYGSCRGEVPPSAISRARAVVFAGDHAITGRGISVDDPAQSARLADELAAGAGPTNTLARAAGASVRVVDVSLNREAGGSERVTRASASIDVADAMTEEQLERALAVGKRLADQEVDSGADVLIPGSLGVGGDVVAAALVGALTRTEPVAIVGAGYELDPEVWKRRVSVVRDAMFRVRSDIDQPLQVLRMISSPDIAALVSFCAQAAVRRTPVLLDDPVTAAAALVADRLAPGARLWFQAAQYRTEPAQQAAFRDLGLTPLLELGIGFDSGAGALTVLPLLRSGVELLRDASGTRDAAEVEAGEA